MSETRQVALKRDGNVKASRWCAGCHDVVPFFSGAFDDPNFDIAIIRRRKAGITCTACHAITHVNSTRGNADYTIEEPMHYPFAYSSNALLQYVNNQLVKAKPEFHKKTFLKPLHKTAEFCSTCHKVSLPQELTNYKEFLRGQNHYDTFLLSGVSGHNARSFYYPPKAEANCNGCHMPLKASQDFGANYFNPTNDDDAVHPRSFVPGGEHGRGGDSEGRDVSCGALIPIGAKAHVLLPRTVWKPGFMRELDRSSTRTRTSSEVRCAWTSSACAKAAIFPASSSRRCARKCRRSSAARLI